MHPPARELLARRKAGGDGGMEALRILKRRLSDVVYRAMLTDETSQLPRPLDRGARDWAARHHGYLAVKRSDDYLCGDYLAGEVEHLLKAGEQCEGASPKRAPAGEFTQAPNHR